VANKPATKVMGITRPRSGQWKTVEGGIDGDTKCCKWEVKEEEKIVYARFKRGVPINNDNKRFMFELMEKMDVSVVASGLFGVPRGLTINVLKEGTHSNGFHHKIALFQYGEDGKYTQMPENYFMSVQNFCNYLVDRQKLLDSKQLQGYEVEVMDSMGKMTSLKVSPSDLIYGYDLNMKEGYPSMLADFRSKCRVPEIYSLSLESSVSLEECIVYLSLTCC